MLGLRSSPDWKSLCDLLIGIGQHLFRLRLLPGLRVPVLQTSMATGVSSTTETHQHAGLTFPMDPFTTHRMNQLGLDLAQARNKPASSEWPLRGAPSGAVTVALVDRVAENGR